MTATSLDPLRTSAPARSLDVTVNLGAGRVEAAVRGTVDVRSVGALRRDLLHLVGPGLVELHLDLTAAVFTDHTGPAALVHLQHRCRQHGVELHVVAPPMSSAYRALAETGLFAALRIDEGATT